MSGQSREWGFSFMHFGVPPPGPELRVAFIPVTDAQVMELAGKLGAKLVEPLPDVPPEIQAKVKPGTVLVAPAAFAQVDVPGYPPLHAKIERFGQTAMVATWIHHMTIEVATGRRGGKVQAVSLYLSGIDRDADAGAVSFCRSLRFGSGALLPVAPDAYEKIRQETKPLAVQIFCQSLARVDPSIRCAFLALGTAFFGSLGVEEEHDDAENGEAPTGPA
jgi:hypothetical protein